MADVCQEFHPNLQGTKFSDCGTYVILSWDRPTRHEFIMPGHNQTPRSVSPFPCVLASEAGFVWIDRAFETWSATDCVCVEIRRPGSSIILHRIYLTSIPSSIGQCNATLLNGDQNHPNLRLLLRRKGGLAAIKQLRMTWDEFLLKIPSTPD